MDVSAMLPPRRGAQLPEAEQEPGLYDCLGRPILIPVWQPPAEPEVRTDDA